MVELKMLEGNNKKKESKRKDQERGVSIKAELGQKQEERVSRNQEQAKLNEKESQGKEKGESGGRLLKGIVNFIRGIFTATIDMPRQKQSSSREESTDQQKSEIQGQWIISSTVSKKIEQDTKKNPENLDQKKIEEAAEGLKEGLKRSDNGNQPIGMKSPCQTPAEARQEKDGQQIS